MKGFLYTPSDIPKLQAAFKQEWGDFRDKRDMALARKDVTDDDWLIIHSADGTGQMGHALLASNGAAANRIVRQALHEFRIIRGSDPTLQFLHITNVDDDWTTSDEQTNIDLPVITKQSRNVLSKMGLNWHAVIEVRVFSNLRHPDGGKVLSPHSHGIIWGRDIYTRAQEVAEDYNSRISATVQGARAVDVKLISPTWMDLARVVRYPWKAQDRCKNVYINREKGIIDINESEAADRWIRYLRLFQIHSMLEMNRLCFASGQGCAVRRAIFNDAFAWLEKRVPRATRSLHVEALTAFWAEFMPRLGWHRFVLPNIILR